MALNNVNLSGSDEKFYMIIKEVSRNYWQDMKYEAFVVNNQSNDTIFRNKSLFYIDKSQYYLFENHLYQLDKIS